MLNLLLILVVLFAALALLIPFLEKRGEEPSPEKLARLSKWIVPLIAAALVLQGIKYLLG